MSAKALLSASVSAPPAVYVEDVFSTYLYTGNGSTQTITNGIDLSGEGGLVWTKPRVNDGVNYHALFDTARGAGEFLSSNSTSGQNGNGSSLSAFTSTGFTLGSNGLCNGNTYTYASWTFRKAEKFFDVVTYTGTGSARTIAHNLGSVPGCIIVKCTNSTDSWFVYHVGTGAFNALVLNSTDAAFGNNNYWSNTSPTSSVFSVGSDLRCNGSGQTYVAYLFAHDAGGFGDAGTDSVVSCGSYTGNGSTSGPTVTLGWEPQWVLIKASSQSGSWVLFDTMRGIPTGGSDSLLVPNTPAAEETASNWLDVSATGFQPGVSFGNINSSGQTYIYIAIRRGPMKTPESGTEVFSALTQTGTGIVTSLSTGFPVDMVMSRQRFNTASFCSVVDRLRGVSSAGAGTGLLTQSAQHEAGSYTNEYVSFDQAGITVGSGPNQLGNASNAFTMLYHFFRRAPGFFDVVAYKGTGSANSVSHNLGVAPELIIVKSRSGGDWATWATALGLDGQLLLNNTNAAQTLANYWSGLPTSSSFSVSSIGYSDNNGNGSTYIAYLFATAPGVSKVGSYTGTGTTLNIDCGFTAGARFILIKRTDSTGDWYVWDTARGIISGNDPYLLLNSTAAEIPYTDYIDPLSSGFQISSTAPAAINASGGSFIFLAIA